MGSATEGTGIEDLLETMHLQSEVLELRANPKGAARAVVIESRVEAGKGPTATAIVQSGTFRKVVNGVMHLTLQSWCHSACRLYCGGATRPPG